MTILKTAARETREIQSLQLVHSDVCSPMRMHTLDWRSEVFKVKYYVMFVDDYTWCCTACLLHERQYKSTVFDKFIKNLKPMFSSTFALDKNFANGQWW